MSQYLYADGIGNLTMVNGMVRLQFLTVVPPSGNAQGGPVYDPAFSVVLTPLTFLQSYKKMEELIQKMIEAGVLVKQGEERREGPARDSIVSPVSADVVKPEMAKASSNKTNRTAAAKNKS
jgi:hypothetical protein